ncbi:MAG: family 43 glycosylhydrolase, partial [Clostridiales bacterium]|nr:family 43 glycosylhydrolase [Clostridiales bacterium]
GEKWLDTNGKPIQAHGFSVFYSKKDKMYYWYGENKEKTKGGPFNKIWHWGVRCYASKDLYNWEDKGLIIPPQPNDLSSPLHPTYCMDRPHIIYCEKTGKYIAWLKIMCGPINQFMSVLQSDNFLGPYYFVHKIYKPLNMNTGDFTLAIDEKSKKAYIIFDRPHFELVTATLSDTYTEVSGEFSEHYMDLHPPFSREAPTWFERNGKQYLFTSGTSGYYPNPSQVCIFDDWHGKYQDLGDPCVGDNGTTFYSQITCVLKVPDKNLYIAMADRWKPTVFGKWFSKKYYKLIERAMSSGKHENITKPDRSPKTAVKLPEKEQIHMVNTSISRYVWLPIEWQNDKPIIRWHDEWRIEDYK